MPFEPGRVSPKSSIGDGRAVLETSRQFHEPVGPRRASPGPRGAPRCGPGQSAGAGRARWLCTHQALSGAEALLPSVWEPAMPRLPLLLLLLPSLAWGLGLRDAGRRHPECSPCQPDRCPAPSPCPAPWISARDECGCCARCLGAEGASCGGRVGARCGPGLVCASRASETAPEGTGLCVCAQRGAVCGSDGRSYSSICALRLRARLATRAHHGHLHKVRDGPCEFGE